MHKDKTGVFFIIFITLSAFLFVPAFAEEALPPEIEPGIAISGANQGDWLSSSAGSGDINGDGIPDVIISAIGASPMRRQQAGEVYVFYGGMGLSGEVDLTTTKPDVTIIGANPDDKLGISIATPAGDVNGDTIDDLVMGAIFADPKGKNNAGCVYVIYGGEELPQYIDTAQGADIIISGESENDWLGVVSVEDVNNDGIDDIIIGASKASPGGRKEAGKAYIIFGRTYLPGKIDLSKNKADIEISGRKEADRSGWPATAGDINGDGLTDIIISAPTAYIKEGENVGKVQVIFGREGLKGDIDLSSTLTDLLIAGEETGDVFGTLVVTDVNSDGMDDLIISAPYADVYDKEDAGKVYIVFGKEDFPKIIDLKNTPADIVILGEYAGDNLGSSLSTCNVNGDRFGDVIIGAPLADTPEAKSAGKTYILLGRRYLPAVIDLSVTPLDYTFYGIGENEQSSTSVASTDIDNDGNSDILIGSIGASPRGRTHAGQSYIIQGWKLR